MDLKITHLLKTTEPGPDGKFPVYVRIYYRRRAHLYKSRLLDGHYSWQDWESRYYASTGDLAAAAQQEKSLIQSAVEQAAASGVYHVQIGRASCRERV